jgi:hypothetical protein
LLRVSSFSPREWSLARERQQPKQLISETRAPVPVAPGQPARLDYEYTREGVCNAWMFVEPLGGWRSVRISARKTAVDWAEQVRGLVDDPRYATAEKIRLVCDNLNVHTAASLYEAFSAVEALRIARRLEMVHTPKHGSWLNIAESELSVLTRQCLGCRLASQDLVVSEARHWNEERNALQVGVDWQFTTEDARIKLKHLYPKIKT